MFSTQSFLHQHTRKDIRQCKTSEKDYIYSFYVWEEISARLYIIQGEKCLVWCCLFLWPTTLLGSVTCRRNAEVACMENFHVDTFPSHQSWQEHWERSSLENKDDYCSYFLNLLRKINAEGANGSWWLINISRSDLLYCLYSVSFLFLLLSCVLFWHQLT